MIRLIFLSLAFLMCAQPASAASFDCAKAGTKVEKMICADPELSKLDEDLGNAYSKALKTSSDSSVLKQQQRDWLKKRNGCVDAKCVKQAYEQRLPTISGLAKPSADSTSIDQSANANQRYSFQLTKGAGTEVCDAYLKRLNNTEFTSPPYCGRPENDSVKGFTKLNRVNLSSKDVRNFPAVIFNFMQTANREDMDWTDLNTQERLIQARKNPKADVKGLQSDMDSGWAKIWGYSPPIDINNDGNPDNVEIWHGTPVLGTGGTRCGEYGFRLPDVLMRQPQIAFVVSDNGNRLDVAKTEKVFGHPSGGYHFYSNYQKKWIVSGDFRPIGKSIGIFEFKNTFYFDTFFDGWGDFEDKRRTEGAVYKGKNKEIYDTLGVFLHEDGKTNQVCEYLMTDREAQRNGGN